jgi:4-hydroxy-tetrahydrodipicolinate synthase
MNFYQCRPSVEGILTTNNPGLVNTASKLRARLDGGLIPAVPVPFDEAGRLHAKAQDSYLHYMAKQPVAGVAVWVHTGRGLLLDDETALRVLRDWRSALNDRVLIAGAGAAGDETPEQATARAIAMAERAAKEGADALLIYAPTWLRDHARRDKLIIEYHVRLADIGLPLVLFYLYEAAGGISYSHAVLNELLAHPSVIGIKIATLDSIMTYQDVARLLTTHHPDKVLITGEDRFLGYSLRRGARAALIGMGAICCAMQAELVSCHLRGDLGRFLTLSDKADLLAESIFISPIEGYITRLLWSLVHLDIIPLAAAHDPWGPQLPRREFEAVGRTLAALEQIC